jgi:CheY-like chemotaxis protein
MMPDMDGIEVTAEIRAFGGDYKVLPIIALTANAIQGAKEMFMINGFSGFVPKPIKIIELALSLRQFISPEKIDDRTANVVDDLCSGESADKTGKTDGFWNELYNIEEINTIIGLGHVSGMVELYHDTLKSFYKKLPHEIGKMEECINGGDLSDFSIKVHGIKSVLATIGAVQLSQSAYELETASKNFELIYCKEYSPVFFSRLRELHKKLALIFPGGKEFKIEVEGTDKLLNQKINEALTAAENFDYGTGEDIMDELLGCDYGSELRETFEFVKKAFSAYDCDEAAEKLKSLGKTE